MANNDGEEIAQNGSSLMLKLKPIKPKGLGEVYKRLPKAVEKGMKEATKEALKDFEKTTRGWEHNVSFSVTEQGNGEYLIGTNDEIWKYVDEGTRPHTIRPRGRFLKFAPGSKAKTKPGGLISGSGVPGSGVVFARVVRHPGTKARLFSQQIARRWSRGVSPFIRAALQEAM